MIPGSELLQDLRAVLPTGVHAYRLTIRRGKDLSEGVETGDPVIALANLRDLGADAECRVEIAGSTGDYSTLVPYFWIAPAAPRTPIAMTGPVDPAGLPVRAMIYDEVERTYLVDYARFGAAFAFDAADLPMEHLLRVRFHHWSPQARGWEAVGPAMRLPGTGKLGRPAIYAHHRDAARALVARLKTVMPPGARKPKAALEFYDNADFLSDVAADADDATLEATLAELAAGASVLDLRVRLAEYRADGSKAPGPLVNLWDLAPAFVALTKLLRGAKDLRGRAMTLLDLTTADDGPALASYVADFLYRALPEGIAYQTHDWLPEPIGGLCQAWAERPDRSRLIGEALNYVRAYAALAKVAEEQGALRRTFIDPDHLLACIEPTLAILDAASEPESVAYGPRMLRAKLETLRDRERAAGMFEAAQAMGSAIAPICGFDHGVATYISHARLTENAAELSLRRMALLGELETISAPPPSKPGPVWLFSCDPRFLRIYMPHWLSVAEYCKARDVDLHFIVVGDAEAAAEALARVDHLRRALATFREADPETFADNITLSTWPTPDWCTEPRTFYACARYLAIGELTARFDRDILVQDMDFTLTDDPRVFMALFPQPGFGIQPSKGLYGIDPWRRFMGGCFYAPATEGARRDLEAMEFYIIEGLTAERSWYLDQNALSYLFERTTQAGETPFWPQTAPRPTQQPKSNSLYESLQG